jgi:hypothetical protein
MISINFYHVKFRPYMAQNLILTLSAVIFEFPFFRKYIDNRHLQFMLITIVSDL